MVRDGAGSVDQPSVTSDGGQIIAGDGGPTPGNTVGSVSDVETVLTPLPELRHVVATTVGDSVEIDFRLFDEARDYRVFVLPKDEDITLLADGKFTAKDAVYRCAGDRQTYQTHQDVLESTQGLLFNTLVDGQAVEGYGRKLADATLGFVFDEAGEGRVPVYAMGDSAKDADNDCNFQGGWSRWQASRAKKYTASETERQMLLSQGWRDDGVAFYAPSAASGDTRAVFTAGGVTTPRVYFAEGPEADQRGSSEAAFSILKQAGAGTIPLMRVFYLNFCGRSHDELVTGAAYFQRARYQGDAQPVDHLHWSGISAETTLVVEALKDGCPNQGYLAPEAAPARGEYAQWFTLAQLRQASATGEVFINGQHEAGVTPQPIARSFVRVRPQEPPKMDWFMGFSEPNALGDLLATNCGVDNCWASSRYVSDAADISFMLVEDDRQAMSQELGELWIAYADVAADVNGKFRLTAPDKATMADNTFLHVTMTVDAFTTGRRYPQLIISDQDVPVQYNMEHGHALVLQTFGGWPYTYELQVCDHQFWDVNNQCPRFDSEHRVNDSDPDNFLGMLPATVPGEHTSMDRGTKFDVYASTKRAYWFLDGVPHGCADLPPVTVGAGPVTVTFGDVLYHSGVDETFDFTGRELQLSTRRHFDNLGYSSGVAAPAWDEARLPCAKALR